MSKATLTQLLSQYTESSANIKVQEYFLTKIIELMELTNKDSYLSEPQVARAAYISLVDKCQGKSVNNPAALVKLSELNLYPWNFPDIDNQTKKDLSNILCRIVIGTEVQGEDHGYSLTELESDINDLGDSLSGKHSSYDDHNITNSI